MPTAAKKPRAKEAVESAGAERIFGFPWPDPAVELALKHPAISISVLVAGTAIVKLLLVTHLQIESSLALVAAAGPASVVLGLVVAAMPTFDVVLALLVFWLARRWRRQGRASWLLSIVWPVLAVLAVFYTSLLYLFVLGILATLTWYLVVRRRWFRPGYNATNFIDSALFGVIIATVASGTAWLPPEIITARSSQPFVAYVAGIQGPWLVLLTEKDRTVKYVSADDVETRTLCGWRTAWGTTLDDLMRGGFRSSLPACSSAEP